MTTRSDLAAALNWVAKPCSKEPDTLLLSGLSLDAHACYENVMPYRPVAFIYLGVNREKVVWFSGKTLAEAKQKLEEYVLDSIEGKL